MVEQATQTDGTVTSPSPETSEEKQPATFTQEQMDAAVKKGTSDALAGAGRDFKTLEETRKANVVATKSLNEREAALRKTQNTVEDEKFKDDPDGFKAMRLRREAQQLQETNAVEREALDEREKTVTAAASVINATKIAAESKVDATTLLKFTDGTEEAMKELALQLHTPEAASVATITPDPGTGSGATTQAPKTALDNAKKLLEQAMASPSQDKSKTM